MGMKRLWLVVAVIALAVPAAAPAKRGGGHDKSAKQCKAMRDQMGAKAFGETFKGKHAKRKLRRCEKKLRKARLRQAKRACRAERRADPAAFEQRYGTPVSESKQGKRRGHLLKRCVRERLDGKAAPSTDELKNAAKECRAAQQEDPEGFAEEYGDGSNAFAKCVVAHAQEEGEDPESADGDEGDEPEDDADEVVDEPGDEPDPDDLS